MDTKIHVLTGEEARAANFDEVQWPPDAVVIYALDGLGVAGRTSIIELPHLEGTEVREDKRGTRLAAQLVTAAEETLRHLGRTHAFAFALNQGDPSVANYLLRFGYSRFPVEVYCKNLTEAGKEAI